MVARLLGFMVVLVLLFLGPSPHADLDCDGLDDLLTSGLAASTFVTTTTLTITAWIKVQSVAEDSGTCWPGHVLTGDAGGYLVLGRYDNAEFCGFVFPGSSIFVTTPSPVGWSHLAVTLGGGTLTLWHNGTNVGSTPAGPIENVTEVIRVCAGAGSPESRWLGDRVTEVRYYDVALSAGEIATLGQSRLRLPGRTTPTAYWPLTDCADGVAQGDGVTFRDRSGNNRHLTTDNGANGTGLTCRASEHVRLPWGPH